MSYCPESMQPSVARSFCLICCSFVSGFKSNGHSRTVSEMMQSAKVLQIATVIHKDLLGGALYSLRKKVLFNKEQCLNIDVVKHPVLVF